MNLHKTGDWERIGQMVAGIGMEMKKARTLSLKRFGLYVEALTKGHISKQDLGWAPLNKDYKALKVRKGLSENILVATSTYFQSITSWVVDDMALIGVKRSVMAKDGTTELANIAAIHEFGAMSVNIRARPLWRPSLDEGMIWQVAYNNPAEIFLAAMKKRYS